MRGTNLLTEVKLALTNGFKTIVSRILSAKITVNSPIKASLRSALMGDLH